MKITNVVGLTQSRETETGVYARSIIILKLATNDYEKIMKKEIEKYLEGEVDYIIYNNFIPSKN